VDWQTEIQAELEKAEHARSFGNEARARVCARRAAGIGIREYFARQGSLIGTPSAYDLIKLVEDDTSIGAEARRSAAYLAMRVNEEFNLPENVDLISEAKKLCDALLN
jgi:hypothetical protein